MTQPPYRRVAADIRSRITSGELAPGARVPSTREITREWGVAMATAAKALRVLSDEGWVRPEPRVGTVVARAASPATQVETNFTRDRIVTAAIEIADAEGLRAVSMRGVATRLGVTTMAPYRHVTGKDELVLLMIDKAFAEPLPDMPAAQWRTRLETAARAQWALYRRHPWLARATSLTRPQVTSNLLALGEWMLASVDGLPVDTDTKFRMYLSVFNHVRGTAVNLEWEREAEADSGLTAEQWLDRVEPSFRAAIRSGDYPVFSRVIAAHYEFDPDLDSLFEFGLRNLLDGMAAEVNRRAGPPPPAGPPSPGRAAAAPPPP